MDGIINVYKEKGFTSFDVVAKLRGILRMKKIGHTGTLDPDAEGVLPVCLGQATKLCELLTDHNKVYRAVLHLGVSTDTEDASGEILEEKSVDASKEEIEAVILGFQKTYGQIPPMYSAIRVNGKHLYELARKGEVIQREPRTVTVTEIKILEWDLPFVTMEIHCSKGTYIRSLCRDIGEAVGCGGCMESLLRIQTGNFTLETAYKLSEIETMRDEGRLAEHIWKLEDVFAEYPKAVVQKEYQRFVYNGNKLPKDGLETSHYIEERLRVYDRQGHFLGIYEKHGREYRPWKMFIQAELIEQWKKEAGL